MPVYRRVARRCLSVDVSLLTPPSTLLALPKSPDVQARKQLITIALKGLLMGFWWLGGAVDGVCVLN